MNIHDPGHAVLRRALRVAIVVPLGFAVPVIAGAGPQVSVFASFGLFSLLAMGDFGGPPRRRLLSYLFCTLAGAALIAIGTPVSGQAVAAAALTLPVAFAVRFAGNLGGPAASAVTPLTLGFVLAVALDAPASAIDQRLLGWCGAGLLATAAALLMWPRYERPALVRALAGVVRRFADAVAAEGPPEALAEAGTSLRELRSRVGTDPLEHSGSMTDELAYRRILRHLVELESLLPLDPDSVPGAPDLRAATRRSLLASAELLDSGEYGVGWSDALEGLDAVRVEHRTALQEGVRSRLEAEADPAEVIDWVDATFSLRVASFLAASVAATAPQLAHTPPAESRVSSPEVKRVLAEAGSPRTVKEVVAARLKPGSTRLRDGLRGAVGMTLAVFVATVTDISHGFWVVLATLMVLRSNARGTGRTALDAVGGTTLGFLVATPLMIALGAGPVGLWIVLPIAAFGAAYATAAINFVVGQAAFALFVVILFNLVEPTGWEVGLVRVETVAIGAAVSLVAGLLLWPRGALVAVGRCASAAHRSAARFLADGLRAGTVDPDAVERRRAAAVEDAVRTSDAIAQHRGEPGKHLTSDQVTAVLDGPRLARATAEALFSLRSTYTGGAEWTGGPPSAGEAAVVTLDATARCLDSGGGDRDGPVRPSAEQLRARAREEIVVALGRWDADREPVAAEDDSGALRIVWERDWLLWLNSQLREFADAVEATAETIAAPWWRR